MLRQLRQDVVLVGVDRVAGMSDQEFKDCLEFVGNASNWADKDLTVLLARAKQVRTKDRHSLAISYHYYITEISGTQCSPV